MRPGAGGWSLGDQTVLVRPGEWSRPGQVASSAMRVHYESAARDTTTALQKWPSMSTTVATPPASTGPAGADQFSPGSASRRADGVGERRSQSRARRRLLQLFGASSERSVVSRGVVSRLLYATVYAAGPQHPAVESVDGRLCSGAPCRGGNYRVTDGGRALCGRECGECETTRNCDSLVWKIDSVSAEPADSGKWSKSVSQYYSLPRPKSSRLHPDSNSRRLPPDSSSGRLERRASLAGQGDLTSGHPRADMPGRVSSIPVFQRRAAGAQALEQSPQRRPLSADQAPRKQSDPAEVGRGRSGAGVQSTRTLVQRPQSDSRLVAPYPALPRARIEYCAEAETTTPRASFRPRSRGRISGVRDEGSRSPRPPVYRGPRSRPAGTAQAADPTQVSDRSRAASERSPTTAPGRGRHRTGHRENVSRNPRGASDPIAFSSTGSSRAGVQTNSPQGARTPSGGTRGSPRHHCSGIPTRRTSTAEAAVANGSTSSINLSDISGLSVATISPSLSPLCGGTSQTVRPCRNEVDARRNGCSLPRRSRTRASESDPIYCNPPAELVDRRGPRGADQRRAANSRTSVDKIGTGDSAGPPCSRSRNNVGRSSAAVSNERDEYRSGVSNERDEYRSGVRREADSRSLEFDRSSSEYANIRKGIDEAQTETTAMHSYVNRKQELNDYPTVDDPEYISRISTLKAPVKSKVQRSLSLQSSARPSTSNNVRNDRAQSSVGVALDGALQSLPDLQTLVDGACDSSTDDSTGCQKSGQLNRTDNVHRDKDRFISDSISARNPVSGASVAVKSFSPSSAPSKHHYRDDDSCDSKYSPGRNRQTTTICDLKAHQEDVTHGHSPPSADRFVRTCNYNGMHHDGLALGGSDDRTERRLSVISRTSRGEASGCESSTESCSGSGSVCLSVGSPQRRQSVERSIYSSVIHVNGKEDGYVTNKTRIQRSWQDSAEIQATIQGEKDADENKVRLSLNVDGDFLNDQFDAIIETLKQVATSVQEQDSGRRSSVSTTSDRPTRSFDPIYAEIRSPVITYSPIDEPIYSEIPSPDPQCSITPKEFPAVATPRSQASHNAFFDSSPTLDQLARRLHADASQLSQDCDYVNFHDLESPYRTTKCVPQSASDIISSAGLQHPTMSASSLFNADRNSYQSSGPHSIDLNNIPYSRNLESVQECSENGSRPDSCEGSSSYETHLRKQVVKRTLARSLSDKGGCSRPVISMHRCSSECDSDTEKSVSKGVFARLLESERGQRLADSNGSVFSSTTDTGSGRSLETRSHSSDRKRRSRNSTTENCVDARRVKRRDAALAAPRDWKLRGLDRLMRGGWRTRQSHSMGDEYRDATITIDDFIASLYAHQGFSAGEAAVLSDSDLKMPSASSANREHSPAVRSNSANVVPSGVAAAEGLVGLARAEASSQPSSPVLQRRSVSLPKTFLADRYGLAGIKAAIPSVLFPWRRSTSRSDDGDVAHATDDVTARSKDGVEGPDVAERRRAGGVTKQQRQWKTCSSPLLPDRRDGPGWECPRTWSTVYDEGDAEALAGSSRDELAAGCCVGEEQHPTCSGPRSLQADIGASSPLPGTSESVLQKFRKSFSLRFQRRGATASGCGDMDTTAGEEGEDAPAVDDVDQARPSALPQEVDTPPTGTAELLQRPGQDAVASVDDESGDRLPVGVASRTSPRIRRQDSSHDESDAEPGLRWAGCAWRSSTDRHRGRLKKESRSIKCGSADSGDSGILVELSASPPPAPRETAGDTETPTADLPPLSAVSVPSVAGEHKTDPSEDVHRRGGKAVRRARSDVGGQLARGCNSSTALRGPKTSCSGPPQPAAIQEHPAAATDPADGCCAPQQLEQSAAGDGSAAVRRCGFRSASTRLRRTMSEPIITYPSTTTSMSSSSLLSRPGRHHRLPPHHQHAAALADDRYQRRRPRQRRGDAVTDDDAISESDDELLVSDSDETRRHRPRGGRQRQRRHQDRSPTTFDGATDSPAVFAEAHWDYITLDPEELAFRAGDVIQVLDCTDSHWWYGTRHGSRGWFLAAFVRLRVSQEETVEEVEAGDACGVSTARRSTMLVRKQSVSLLSHDQVRAKVVMEIVNSERAFVQDLVHVIEGYLEQVLRRPDLFSEQQVSAVFGNIRALHSFQSDLLQRLEARVDRRRPHESRLGQLFVQCQHGFAIYADYCNNHPAAVAQLQQLYGNSRYRHFFEACRLLRAASDISLDGFLLTPIQKICKYPLQLAELLKYTRPGHADHEPVRRAQAAMKAVAVRVNEAKRRMESLEQLASWQMNVEGWMGPDLLDTSSELIHQAEVTKLTSSSWSRELCTLFLFDHLLVYCRRDLLKRSTLQFRGRINLDTAQIIDIADGKDEFSGASVKHAVRVHSPLKNKWYIFCCKTDDDKVRWMLKFREERIRISRDQESGFRVLEKFRDLARSSAENHLNRPKKPKSAWFSFGQNKNQNKKRSRSQAPLVITSRRQSVIAHP